RGGLSSGSENSPSSGEEARFGLFFQERAIKRGMPALLAGRFLAASSSVDTECAKLPSGLWPGIGQQYSGWSRVRFGQLCGIVCDRCSVTRSFLHRWKNPIKNRFASPVKNENRMKIFYPVISYMGITYSRLQHVVSARQRCCFNRGIGLSP